MVAHLKPKTRVVNSEYLPHTSVPHQCTRTPFEGRWTASSRPSVCGPNRGRRCLKPTPPQNPVKCDIRKPTAPNGKEGPVRGVEARVEQEIAYAKAHKPAAPGPPPGGGPPMPSEICGDPTCHRRTPLPGWQSGNRRERLPRRIFPSESSSCFFRTPFDFSLRVIHVWLWGEGIVFR